MSIELEKSVYEWDYTTDILVAGSGVAGLGAAIAARDAGHDVLIVESTEKWGGTSFLSGGALWLPDNPLMQRDQAGDSPEEALSYLNDLIGDAGPSASDVRRRAFVNGIAEVVERLEQLGMRWRRCSTYPDYFPHRTGGRVGRSLEVAPFDVKKLGDWYDHSRSSQTMPMPLSLNDFAPLARIRSLRAVSRMTRIAARMLWQVIRRRKPRGMGEALTSAMMAIARRLHVQVWLNSPLMELVSKNGVVVGAIIEKEGRPYRVRTTGGVVLATGGFARNRDWRVQYQGRPGWSATATGEDGSGIRVGIALGAATALMDAAWWVPVFQVPDDPESGILQIWERSMPHSLVVDQQGQRFVNESMPYCDFIQAVIDHHRDVPAIPCWIIADRRHTSRYLNLGSTVGIKKLIEGGAIVDAATLPELAVKIGVPADALAATVERFNSYAKTGQDLDYHRGENAYEHYYGDPHQHPNPNLGEIVQGPFRAIQILPGDIGTKGGLLTDEYARVLDQHDAPIRGLYAAGNATASVMGYAYPGAGGTLGPALVFGFIAGQQAAKAGRD